MTAPPSPEVTRAIAEAAAARPAAAPGRLESLDAFRGLIMLMMASAGFELWRISDELTRQGRGNSVLQFFAVQFNHAKWAGCTLWDLIQPAFMFMVGVALPWSIANRRARGQSVGNMAFHALLRAVALVVLSVFLQSYNNREMDWTFPNVLAQIGLAYPFLFLVSFAKPRTQWIVAFGILLAYWLLFALYPLPPDGFEFKSVGVTPDWREKYELSGFAAHWNKGTNPAAAFDRWFLNLLPRPRYTDADNVRHFAPYLFNGGGYQTLNFVPSLATMIFGVLAGQLLRSALELRQKLMRLVIAGLVGIALGGALHYSGVSPMVKPIWTPSFAIYSTGWVLLMLSAFVAVMELKGWKRWAFPLVVAGLNPITLYCMWQMVVGGVVRDNFKIHFGNGIFQTFGPMYERSLERTAHLLVMWLILWWMYRRKIFIRI